VNVLSIAKYYTKFEVAEINRGPKFLDAPLAQTLPILVVKVVSQQATPQAQVVYKI